MSAELIMDLTGVCSTLAKPGTASIHIASPALSDAGLLFTGNQDVAFPAANLQNMQPTRVWRTQGLADAYVEIDLGTSASIDVVALLYTNASAVATARVRAAATQSGLTNAPGYDTGDVSHWPTTGLSNWDRTHFIHHVDPAITFRWWRIDVSDPDNIDGYYEAGRLYVSAAWKPLVNLSYGWRLQWVDPSLREQALGGPTFVTARKRYRRLDFSLDWVTEQEFLEQVFEIDRLRGSSRDLLVVRNIDDPQYLQQQAIYGLQQELTPAVSHKLNKFRKRYRIEELL